MEENTAWTSIDLYYKGVHIKKSLPDNVKIEDLIRTVDTYLAAGFLPSWNVQTNNGHSTPQTPVVVPPVTVATYSCKTCGQPANFKEGNKNGKHWSGYFCTADKEHVSWGK